MCNSCASSFALILVTYSDFENIFSNLRSLRAFCSPLFPDKLNTLLIAFCFAGQMCFSWVQPHEHNLFGIVRRVNERTSQTIENNITHRLYVNSRNVFYIQIQTAQVGIEMNSYVSKGPDLASLANVFVTIFVVTVTVSGAQAANTIATIFLAPKCKNVQLRLEEKKTES